MSKTLNLIDDIVNDQINEWRAVLTSSLIQQQQHQQPPSYSIVYQYGEDKVSNQLLLIPFKNGNQGSSSVNIDLTRLINLIQFNLLDNHIEVKVFLNELSHALNHARKSFFKQNTSKSESDSSWYYLSLLKFVNEHFYNNTNPFIYFNHQQEPISCTLFTFEYLMCLFIQFTRYLNDAKSYQSQKAFHDASLSFKEANDIIEYMMSYLHHDEQDHNKFLFVQSPDSISSTNSSSSSYRYLTNDIIKSDMSIVIEYFGGKNGLLIINHLLKAQTCEVYYEHACSKLGILNDYDHIRFSKDLSSLTIGINEDVIKQLFEISKTVQSYYDDAWRLTLLSPLAHPSRTKLYYFVIFMKHYWFFRHHFSIMSYYYHLHEETQDSKYAQYVLAKSNLLVNTYNEFTSYNLFSKKKGSDDLISNIISNQTLLQYQKLIENTQSLYNAFSEIVLKVYMTTPIDYSKLDVYDKMDLPQKPSKVFDRLNESLYNHFGGKEKIQSIQQKISLLKEYHHKSSSINDHNDNDDDNESYANTNEINSSSILYASLSNQEKKAILNERTGWITYLLSKLDKDSDTIIINKEDTQKIQDQYGIINNSKNDHSL